MRPLEGGLQAWRDQGFPLDRIDGGSVEVPATPAPNAGGQLLGDVEVLDEHATPVRLETFWQERPIVLAFIRHFGCMLCRAFVAELNAQVDSHGFEASDVIVIGNGDPEGIEPYRKTFGLRFPVYVDPGLRAYEALAFRRDTVGSLNPRVVLAAMRAMRRGARQGAMQGDAWQLGGVVIAAPGGRIAYRYASQYAGDHPSLDQLREELTRAQAAYQARGSEVVAVVGQGAEEIVEDSFRGPVR